MGIAAPVVCTLGVPEQFGQLHEDTDFRREPARARQSWSPHDRGSRHAGQGPGQACRTCAARLRCRSAEVRAGAEAARYDPGIILVSGIDDLLTNTRSGVGLGNRRRVPPVRRGLSGIARKIDTSRPSNVLPAKVPDLPTSCQPVSRSRRKAATAEGISSSASRRIWPNRSVSSGDCRAASDIEAEGTQIDHVAHGRHAANA